MVSLALSSQATADIPLITSSGAEGGGFDYSTSVTALLLVSTLTIAPFIFMMTTPFLRIAIVLSLIRNAMGITNIPSNKVIAAISIIITYFLMAPQIDQFRETAYQPYKDGKINEEQLIDGYWDIASEFMINNTREKSLQTIINISPYEVTDRDDLPASIILVSFITSELTTGLTIGFMCFIPFLIIDLLTGVILMSLGMMMVSPMIISLPLKIGFFVLIDGWSLILKNLALSFN